MEHAISISKYLIQVVSEDYLAAFLGGIFTACGLYIWKWFNGKESEVKDHRIRFFIGATLLGTFVMFFLLGVITAIKPKPNIPEKSDFRSEIEDIIPAAAENSTSVCAMVRLLNNGRQSVAWQWKMTITTVSGQILESSANHNPQVTTLWFSTNKSVEFPADKYLPNMLFDKPVFQGSGTGGWVLFSFPKNMLREFSRSGTKFTLEFQDSFGIRVLNTFVMPPGREIP